MPDHRCAPNGGRELKLTRRATGAGPLGGGGLSSAMPRTKPRCPRQLCMGATDCQGSSSATPGFIAPIGKITTWRHVNLCFPPRAGYAAEPMKARRTSLKLAQTSHAFPTPAHVGPSILFRLDTRCQTSGLRKRLGLDEAVSISFFPSGHLDESSPSPWARGATIG